MDNYLQQDTSVERIELITQDAWKVQDGKKVDRHDSYDRANATRRLCLSAIILSASLGVVSIALGASIFRARTPDQPLDNGDYIIPLGYPHRWPNISVSPVAGEILPLALNAIVTICIDGLGFIHATTLRWALGPQLTFNVNLRLFTSSKSCIALGWFANTLYAIFMILCYTSTSLFFANRPPPSFCGTHSGLNYSPPCGNDVHISPAALYGLGIGLIGQCILVAWQYNAIKVPTWSSNPLDTAWAMVSGRSRRRVPGRTMMSVHDVSQQAGPRQPNTSQRSIWKCHREARWIMRYIWLSFGIAIVFFGAVIGAVRGNVARLRKEDVPCNNCGTYVGPNWNILPDYGGQGTSTAVISEQTSPMYAAMFVIIFLVTGVVTMALHCAELVTVLARDEITWRHCNSKHAYIARQNAAVRAITSWSYILLFLLKVVLHWMIGKGVTYVYNWGIFLRPPQLLYAAIGMGVLAAFATILCLNGPKGPQPATFGHVQTLVDLVDEWSLLMFWGDKGLREEGDEIRHAGTADVPLEPIIIDALYE